MPRTPRRTDKMYHDKMYSILIRDKKDIFKDLVTTKEAAEEYEVSTVTLKRKVRNGEFQRYFDDGLIDYLGGNLVFHKIALDHYYKRNLFDIE